MPCPDESTVAGFMQGTLSPESAAALESHLDQCEDCTALLAALGHVYVPSGAPANPGAPASHASPRTLAPSPASARPVETPSASEHESRSSASSRSIAPVGTVLSRNVMALAGMWIVHAWGSVLAIPVLRDAFGDSPSVIAPPVTTYAATGGSRWWLALALYAVIWMYLGLVWTLLSAYGLAHRKPWARRTTLAYAALSLPTGLGTLFSVYALQSLTRRDIADAIVERRPEATIS